MPLNPALDSSRRTPAPGHLSVWTALRRRRDTAQRHISLNRKVHSDAPSEGMPGPEGAPRKTARAGGGQAEPGCNSGASQTGSSARALGDVGAPRPPMRLPL